MSDNDVRKTEDQVAAGILIDALTNDIKTIAGVRLEAIRKLNTLLGSPILYDENDEMRHHLREKADDFAYELGGYVAAEYNDERLYFWAESY